MLGRLVNALLRKGTGPIPKEQPMKRTIDDYYERTLRLRNEILNGNGIVDNIVNAFESTYLKKERSENVIFIGQGDTHTVLHIGEVIDPYNGRPVHLAVRLKNDQYGPYDDRLRSKMLIPQLDAFQSAFVDGENPPYFVGVVSWKGPKEKFDNRVLGFILEDVSERKKYHLVPDGHVFFFREEERRKRTRFFLDPRVEYLAESESRYLSDEARIDVN